ncbi:23S rRNA G2445 N2-methylase RlmL [Kineococcus xinjiangensis]|uniref:23S rRNA G2445 N2-methylase RlmL n=1 Tax=Kineococcus xinjiangensis TaxID=512762 RepID=A0A2S6IVH3_9ACTN|nr:23S rRNA G2445 N2-methylase RlmL [Kineococcus xinjiangensis]
MPERRGAGADGGRRRDRTQPERTQRERPQPERTQRERPQPARAQSARSGAARSQPARVSEPSVHRLELVHLPGLADVVRGELAELPAVRRVRAVPGREDALDVEWSGGLRGALRLRTVVAPFLRLHFDVPRPRSLLSGEHFPRLLTALRTARDLDPATPVRSFRFDAAGRDSTVLRLLADQITAAARLRHDPDDGAVVIRLRRGGEGWDVLVRLGARPLSARAWRRVGHPAAANATVAAAMTRLGGCAPGDRVANLMCGSGTLLVERLLAGPAALAVGVDASEEAVAATRENLAAAGLAEGARLVVADVESPEWAAEGPFDLLLADPPWGDKAGRHSESEQVHRLLLSRAAEVAAPGARLVVLTHEIRVMGRCLREAAASWGLVSELSVFHKGHHPRIYVLHRQAAPPRS